MENVERYLHSQPASLEEARAAVEALSRALVLARLETQHAKRMDAFIPEMLNKLAIRELIQERVDRDNPFGMFLIDLDNFKKVNDTLGHSVGDTVLLRFGELIVEAFRRETDTVAVGRIGGDEFVVVVDMETGGRREKDLTLQMDNIYAHIRSVEAQLLEGDARLRGLEVGFSIGSALYTPENPVSAGVLYDQADEAMYEEKLDTSNR